MPLRRFACLCVALCLLTACSSDDDDNDDDSLACADIAVAGISLTVTDSITGTRLCDAIVELRDGDHVEKPTGQGLDAECMYFGAYERAGTYTVTATLAGYASASQQVTVTAQGGDCAHVNTQQVALALSP